MVWPEDERLLRAKLILEEAVETVGALGFPCRAKIGEDAVEALAMYYTQGDLNVEEAIDGMCDLIYVAIGAGVQFGVDLDPHFDAVQTANLAKIGGPVAPDGKRLKPEGWRPPNHGPILEAQRSTESEATWP